MKKRTGSREKLEQSKLLHKLRRERKGARKDIRADNAFLAAQRAKDQRERYNNNQSFLTLSKALFFSFLQGPRKDSQDEGDPVRLG